MRTGEGAGTACHRVGRWWRSPGRRWAGTVFSLALGVAAPIYAQTGSPGDTAYLPVADSTERSLTITLHVYNYAHIVTTLLARAEGEATTIFRRAGVEAVWVDCPLSGAELEKFPACQERMGAADFVLRIRSSPMTPKAAAHNDALGSALACLQDEAGCSAEVFYQRVTEWAGSGDISVYQLLGHAMAHEIGHLLLGPNSHSRDGIMRPQWNPSDLRVIAQASLRFTPEQAAHLRAAVLTRTRDQKVGQASSQVTTKRSTHD